MTRSNDRILIVVNGLRMIGGAETQALLLAKSLAERHNKEVQFLSFEEGEAFRRRIEDAGFSVTTIPLHFYSSRAKKLRVLSRVIRHIRGQRVRVLIPFVAVPNKIIGKIWRWTGAEFAFWNQRDEGRNLTGHPAEKRWIENVSSIVSNSFEGRDFLVRTYGVAEDQVTIIPNGVVLPSQNVQSAMRERLGIGEGVRLVAMIANIHGYKDHRTLIEAWRLVLDRLPRDRHPVLVFAGEMGAPTRDLKARAFDLGLCDTLRFAGHVGDIDGLIIESDLGVFSSNLEGCPNGVLEFMAHGKAVVGTDISGVRQALGDGHAETCLVPSESPDIFADRILCLLQNDSLRRALGAANLERIRTVFSVEAMAQGFVDLMDAG